MGSAAPFSLDAHSQSAKIGQGANAVGVPAKEEHGFRPGQPGDQLEARRPIQSFLHQREMRPALSRLEQLGDVVDRALHGKVLDVTTLATSLGGELLHERVVVPAFRTGIAT